MQDGDTSSGPQLPARHGRSSSGGRVLHERPQRHSLTAKQENGLNHKFFLWVFGQWWKVVIPTGLVLAGVAAAVVISTYVPEYQATALINIEESPPFIAFQTERNGGRGASARYVQTQIELMRSPVVLGPVVSRAEIAALAELRDVADPEQALSQNLGVQRVGQSELYNITYQSKSPQAAADVVNAVVAEYLAIQSDEDFRYSQRVIDILDEERRRRSLEVEQQRERVLELAKEVTGKDPFGQNAVMDVTKLHSPMMSVHHQLTEAIVNQKIIQAEIQALREAPELIPDHAVESGLLDLEIENRPEVREMQAEIDAIRADMVDIKAKVLEWRTFDGYVRRRDDLAVREAAIEELKKKLHDQAHKRRMADRKQEHEQAIAALEKNLATLAVKEKLFTEQFNEHMEELKNGGAKSVQLEFARSELAREEGVFEMIAARKLALQTELRAPTRVRLRQMATPPLNPVEPVPWKLLMMSCAPALAAPFALAVLREATSRRIMNSEQLREESKLSVLGEVARFPVRPVVASAQTLPNRQRREMLIFAESIDSLRTNLFLSERMGDGQVLAVTSAASGEGKTTIATSLAVSISGATNRPVLVIDADLRSPDVSDVFATPSHPGLAEVLADRCAVSEAIHRVGDTKTYTMPAGRTRSNPHHVVQPHRLKDLVEKLRPRFAAIVIDTPPILAASEALVYAKAADSVLYCSLCEVTRAQQVRAAVERLQDTGANLAGAVLGGTPARQYANLYGYYSQEHLVGK